jgi:hypothetical protein
MATMAVTQNVFGGSSSTVRASGELANDFEMSLGLSSMFAMPYLPPAPPVFNFDPAGFPELGVPSRGAGGADPLAIIVNDAPPAPSTVAGAADPLEIVVNDARSAQNNGTGQVGSGSGISSITAPRSPELGAVTTTQELLETGYVPGPQGVILNQQAVSFSDIAALGEKNGIEFSLNREDGKWVLYSGSQNSTAMPIGEDIWNVAHFHPSGYPFPSEPDLILATQAYDLQLAINPAAIPKPSAIIWGQNPGDTTFYYSKFR